MEKKLARRISAEMSQLGEMPHRLIRKTVTAIDLVEVGAEEVYHQNSPSVHNVSSYMFLHIYVRTSNSSVTEKIVGSSILYPHGDLFYFLLHFLHMTFSLLLSSLSHPYVSLFLLILVVIVVCVQIALYIKLRTFLKGSDATSLEPRIMEIIDDIASLKKHDEMLAKHVLDIEKRLLTSTRNVSMLRFKALENNASNQSFAIALLDEKGNGIVLSSLHLRDRISIYAKPVEKYVSILPLTDEEKQVIHNTRENQKK